MYKVDHEIIVNVIENSLRNWLKFADFKHEFYIHFKEGRRHEYLVVVVTKDERGITFEIYPLLPGIIHYEDCRLGYEQFVDEAEEKKVVLNYHLASMITGLDRNYYLDITGQEEIKNNDSYIAWAYDQNLGCQPRYFNENGIQLILSSIYLIDACLGDAIKTQETTIIECHLDQESQIKAYETADLITPFVYRLKPKKPRLIKEYSKYSLVKGEIIVNTTYTSAIPNLVCAWLVGIGNINEPFSQTKFECVTPEERYDKLVDYLNEFFFDYGGIPENIHFNNYEMYREFKNSLEALGVAVFYTRNINYTTKYNFYLLYNLANEYGNGDDDLASPAILATKLSVVENLVKQAILEGVDIEALRGSDLMSSYDDEDEEEVDSDIPTYVS